MAAFFELFSRKLVYIIVDTKNRIGVHKVLIPVEMIREIRRLESAVYLNIIIDKVEQNKTPGPNEFSYPPHQLGKKI
jgi:hypothetical protein